MCLTEIKYFIKRNLTKRNKKEKKNWKIKQDERTLGTTKLYRKIHDSRVEGITTKNPTMKRIKTKWNKKIRLSQSHHGISKKKRIKMIKLK